MRIQSFIAAVCAALASVVIFTTVSSTASAQMAMGGAYMVASVAKTDGKKAADFSWSDGKKTIKLSELGKGKPMFINFWATWCPPCRAEIPDIVKLTNELKGKVVFVGVSMDQDRTDEKTLKLVSGFMSKNSMPYPNIIGNNDLFKAYGSPEAIPTTFIVDKNGNIAETIVGSRSKQEFMDALKKVM